MKAKIKRKLHFKPIIFAIATLSFLAIGVNPAQAAVLIPFTNQGTFTTYLFNQNGLTITGSDILSFRIDANNGLGIVDDNVSDGESISFSFDSGGAKNVSFRSTMIGGAVHGAGQGAGNLEAFDLSGASLGSVEIGRIYDVDVSARFPGLISGFRYQAAENASRNFSEIRFEPLTPAPPAAEPRTTDFTTPISFTTSQLSKDGFTVNGSDDLYFGRYGLGVVGQADQMVDDGESLFFSFDSGFATKVSLIIGISGGGGGTEPPVDIVEAFDVNGTSLGTIVEPGGFGGHIFVSNLFDNQPLSSFSFAGNISKGFSSLTFQSRADVLPINIDIKPGNKRNVINPRAKGGIWVAILSDTEPGSPFDPSSQIDIPTVEFGPDGAKAIRHKVKDVNKDGLGDLLLRFKIPETGIACGDTDATLTGETFDSQSFTGTDSIKTVGCNKPKKHHKKKHHKNHHHEYHEHHDKKYHMMHHKKHPDDDYDNDHKRR